MLKTYRKQFVALNMALVGMILLSALVAVSMYTYHDYTLELEKTMRQVLEPLDMLSRPIDRDGAPDFDNASDEIAEADGTFESSEATEESDPSGKSKDISERHEEELSDKKKDDGRPERPEPDKTEKNDSDDESKRDKKIITVQYYSTTDQYSIRSYDLSIGQESIETAAQLAASQEESFGRLPGYKLFYYKDTHPDGFCVALTHVDYVLGSMYTLISVLILIFICAMVLFYILSHNISKVAVRPLEKAMVHEKQFVADVSHQLKTPLTVILANNSILKENRESTVNDQLNWIESTDTAARNMMSIVENMLTLSAVESVERPYTEEISDFSAIVTKAALQMESVAFEKGITPEMQITDGIMINGNQNYLQIVCRGLIDNALKYEPSGGKIRILLEAKKKSAHFTVHNFGSVIPEKDIPHIFERFYRSDSVRDDKKGHGLGLAIVERSVHSMGGTVKVESSKEIGTVFTVTLPMLQQGSKATSADAT